MWRFVEMCGDPTSFFVRSHRGFLVPKPNVKIQIQFCGSKVMEVAVLVLD